MLGFNRQIDAATAEVLCAPGLFIEAIVAPAFDESALHMLTTRPKWKANVRLLQVGPLTSPAGTTHLRQIDGGMLVQEADLTPDAEDQWQVVTAQQPSDQQRDELRFAWQVVRHVKSNAIVLTCDRALCGVGAGQMSRVDSVEIAIAKAGPRAPGLCLGVGRVFSVRRFHRQGRGGGRDSRHPNRRLQTR